jgi:SAM-dependent methyltransferase
MSLAQRFLNQFRRPTGWLGRFNLRAMNKRHSELTDWGLTHVSIGSRDTILDIGCGGGRTVQKLAARATDGRVYGVDFSDASVAVASRLNRRDIEQGRVDIRLGSVSHLPFAGGMFDLATAVETHFYWPDLPADMREVLRVLKPGGTLLIIAEAYKGGKHDKTMQRFAAAMGPLGYSHLDVAEHRQLLIQSGYANVEVVEDYNRGWICAVGRRREGPAFTSAASAPL